MTLGALLSLGVPLQVLEDGLASLGLNEFDLAVHETEYNGSPVTDVDVILHNKEHAWIHPYSGKYRNYAEIKEMIGRSGLSDRVQDLSRRIFDIKAAAESVAHGVPVDEVQFHEVGAVDSITREKLQDELVRLHKETGKTFLFVTHDIEEAVYLADRVVVMTPNPGKVSRILPVELGPGRDRASQDFFRMKEKILEVFNLREKYNIEYAI